MGFTWTVEALISWLLHFFKNARVLQFSKNEDDTFALLDKLKFINNNLPDFLKLKADPDQRGEIGYPLMESRTKGYASTADAGRSTDATWVFADEAEFHPCAEANFAAVYPTIGKSKNTKYIMGTTADTEKIDTFFKKTFIGAMNKSNDFVWLFLPADSRPDVTPEHIEKEKAAIPAHKRQGEYPMTIDDMLTIVKTRKFFDANALNLMSAEIRNPIKQELSDKYPSIKVWKLPVVGRRYCLFTDPSDGKEDPHATTVMDSVTGEGVAESHGKIPADRVALVHDALVRLYNNALNGFELNNVGRLILDKLKDLNTPNQIAFLNGDGKLDTKGKKGWWTGGKLSTNFIYPLEEAVRLNQIVIHSKDCIDEFSQYFVNEQGEVGHPHGGHDDYIDAWGRTWYMRRFVKQHTAEPFSFHYRE